MFIRIPQFNKNGLVLAMFLLKWIQHKITNFVLFLETNCVSSMNFMFFLRQALNFWTFEHSTLNLRNSCQLWLKLLMQLKIDYFEDVFEYFCVMWLLIFLKTKTEQNFQLCCLRKTFGYCLFLFCLSMYTELQLLLPVVAWGQPNHQEKPKLWISFSVGILLLVFAIPTDDSIRPMTPFK